MLVLDAGVAVGGRADPSSVTVKTGAAAVVVAALGAQHGSVEVDGVNHADSCSSCADSSSAVRHEHLSACECGCHAEPKEACLGCLFSYGVSAWDSKNMHSSYLTGITSVWDSNRTKN